MKTKTTILLALAICIAAIKNTNAQTPWFITGNSGTTGNNNFIGTIDNVPFKIRTNNNVRMTISNAGKVGIGITSPVGKLHVKGNTNTPQLIIDASSNQGNSNPLIKLRKSDGTELLWIHSDDTTNTFIGLNAGRMNDTMFLSPNGTRNTFIGSYAGAANNSGSHNTAVGNLALASNTWGWLNTAVGNEALNFNTTGSANTALGTATLNYNTTGSGNTAAGFRALNQNVTGYYNTALGYQALFNNNGERNSAFGYEALLNNYSGVYNTAGGYFSMRENTSGSINTAYGHYSLHTNTTGNWNTATGHQALYYNNGTANTADGLNALYNNTSGNYNTASGYQALFYNTSGSYNMAAGRDAGNNNGTSPSNFTALGYNAGHVGSNTNTIEIGNSSISYIGGQVLWDAWSDRRIKDNIQSNVPGLSFITKLNPVTYNFNIHRQNEICGINDTNEWEGKYDIEKIVQTGLIAQEVEQAAKECDFNFNGVSAPYGNGKLYSLKYAAFVMPLIKAVQELNEALKMQNAELKNINSELTRRIEKLESRYGTENLIMSGALEQNSPNPFSEKTTINYSVPASAQNAELKIYAADGKETKSYIISTKGEGQVEIYANSIAAGIYNYSLMIDGKSTGSRQMVITK